MRGKHTKANHRQNHWRLMLWPSLACCLSLFLGPLDTQTMAAPQPKAPVPATSAKPAEPGTSAGPAALPVEAGEQLILGMKDFGDPGGYTLKTVKTERRYEFTRPKNWKVLPSSSIRVSFQHSPNLLPERSSLNVLVNNRILQTITLGKGNVTATTLNIPIPPNLLKDRNSLSFQVDQHYTYKCEDPFSDELWTTLLEDTKMQINYVPQPSTPNLTEFPYPIFDPLAYEDTKIGYIAPPETLSNESLSAFGAVATGLAQHISWHPMEPAMAGMSALQSNANLVVVGTPKENPAIGMLSGNMSVPLSGDQFVDRRTRAPYPEKTGIIQYIRNPYHPSKVILIISGNSPAGVANAGRLLVQNPTNRLLVGQSAVVDEFSIGPKHPYRAWDGFLQTSGSSFADLGLDTMTTRGITAMPLYYSIKRMPDLYFPGQTKVVLKTLFSYSSQLDNTQSKLEVLLNKKALKSVPLDDKQGKSLAEFNLEIPSEEFHTFNDLEYKFYLYPEKYDMCNFVTDAHIWGTVHNASTIQVPGEIKTPLPDLGLLNDGGFPFTGYQDLTEVAVVLPDQPTETDMNTMLQILSRLGRVSKSKAGINLEVFHATTLPESVKKGYHMIVIGSEERNALFKDFESKLHLLLKGTQETLEGVNKNLSAIQYSPDQGILEEMISPWNEKRIVMLAFGATDTAMDRIGHLFESDRWFGKIEPGNIMVVNANGPQSLTVLEKGKARFFMGTEFDSESGLPTWAMIAIGILSFLGLLSILRFLFGR